MKPQPIHHGVGCFVHLLEDFDTKNEKWLLNVSKLANIYVSLRSSSEIDLRREFFL